MPVPSSPYPLPDLDHVLALTEPLWQDLQGGRIFVTGGTGFFGRWMLEAFRHAQARLGFKGELLFLCRDPGRWRAQCPHLAQWPGIHAQAGDLAGLRAPGGTLHGVAHLAVGTEAPLVQFRAMLEGTLRVLDLAQASDARRLLFASSGAVYGTPPRGRRPIPEDHPTAPPTEDPGTAYGQAKRACEGLFAAHAQALGGQAVLARCFAFVGPGLALDRPFAIGNFIRDALEGRPIRILGDGTPLRSYLHGADLAAWLWTLYFRGPDRRPIHVGSDQAVSIRELADRVAACVRPGLPVTVAQAPDPGLEPSCYVPAIDRARTELGLKPLIGLDDAITRTAEWHRTPR